VRRSPGRVAAVNPAGFLGRGIRSSYSLDMRVLLKLTLDCTPDAAWRALRSPAVLREVVAPWLDFSSLEQDGLPTTWPEGPHRVRALAFRRFPAGEELVDVSYPGGLPTGVRMLRDSGQPETLHAPLVVGADGLRSLVARRLGLAHVSRWPKRLGLVAHFEGFGGMQEWGELHVERDVGYVGLATVDGGLTNASMAVPATFATDESGVVAPPI